MKGKLQKIERKFLKWQKKKKITDEIISDEELEQVAGGIGTASELIGAIARTAEKAGGVNKNFGVEENNEISIPSGIYGINLAAASAKFATGGISKNL